MFAAAFRVMLRVGPGDFTLDAIAREAGVTAGALVQRFGSKRALQIRLAESAAAAMPNVLEGIRARHASPLAALRDYAGCMADLASSPEAFVRSLAYLLEDLTDADLRAQLERQQRGTRTALEAMIRDAVAAGELARETNAVALARAIEALVAGSLLTWAIHRGGSPATWLRRDLDAVVEPYRPRRAPRKRPTKRA